MQLFASPGADESAFVFITDSSGNRFDVRHPVDRRVTYTVRIPPGQPRVTIYHWNTTVPEVGTYRVAGLEQ